MTTRTFRPYEPDDLWLLPPSPRDWLPEDHLAYFLSDLVEELTLKPILQTYGGVTRGTAPYHPRMLVKVLLYAYAVGIPASRQIAREDHDGSYGRAKQEGIGQCRKPCMDWTVEQLGYSLNPHQRAESWDDYVTTE